MFQKIPGRMPFVFVLDVLLQPQLGFALMHVGPLLPGLPLVNEKI